MSETGALLDPAAQAGDTLRRTIMGYMVAQAVFTVNDLRIADRLAAGPRDVAALAAECGADADALRRTLRVLAAEGLFHEEPAGTFTIQPLGELLRTDVPGSLHEFANLMAGEAYAVWGSAAHSVRTGDPAFDLVHGRPYFDWLPQHPQAAAAFNRTQSTLLAQRLPPLLGQDWTGTGTVVDVGGGNGTLLAELLTRVPHLNGVLFDLPHAAEEAGTLLVDRGLADRARAVPGDFFTGVPEGGDVYVLAQILHDWPEDKARDILRSCRAAIPDHGRLLVLEQVLPDGNEPHLGKLYDLHMLVMLGGRERTEADWSALLAAGGFRLDRVDHDLRSSLLTAVPA